LDTVFIQETEIINIKRKKQTGPHDALDKTVTSTKTQKKEHKDTNPEKGTIAGRPSGTGKQTKTQDAKTHLSVAQQRLRIVDETALTDHTS